MCKQGREEGRERTYRKVLLRWWGIRGGFAPLLLRLEVEAEEAVELVASCLPRLLFMVRLAEGGMAGELAREGREEGDGGTSASSTTHKP